MSDVLGVLDVVRSHLAMDVAFVSRIEGGHRTFTHVVAEPDSPVRVGDRHPLESTYCTRIISGELGVLTDDARLDERLRDLDVTMDLDIRAYAGVPIRLADGQVYGTLCAYSHAPRALDIEDAYALQLAAGMIAHTLDAVAQQPDGPAEGVDRSRGGHIRMLFQPVIALRSGEVRGYEALARFDHETVRSPEDWFALAGRLGFDPMLQRQAASRALEVFPELPAGRYLGLNLNDAAILEEDVRDMLDVADADRLVVELTEQDTPLDTAHVVEAVDLLRARGTRLALDDIGAGYAGLGRVLDLGPELLKLDRSLVTGVAHDARRQAMVQAFVTYARAVGSLVVAEGIEDQADADALRILGVDKGQGFLLGVPAARPWDDTLPA